jgi:Fe-S cluster biogenesis protein NfuA
MGVTCRPSPTRPAGTLDVTPIEAALDRLRPFLRRDGSDVQVVGLSGRRVRLRLVGDSGSPFARRRISIDLERFLRDQVPGLDGIDLA